jgi:hypothetical protein
MTSPRSLSFPQSQVWSEKLGLGMRPNSANSPSGILLVADEIIVKPFEVGRLTDLVREKMLTRRPNYPFGKGRSWSVGVILQRCLASIVEGWMVRAKQSKELSWLSPGDDSALDTSRQAP